MYIISLIFFNLLVESGFVSRNEIQYYEDTNARVLKSKGNATINCRHMEVNIISVYGTCGNELVSLTNEVASRCYKRTQCDVNYKDCRHINNSITVKYTCRYSHPLDITTNETHFTYARDNGLIVLRCGLNRFVNIKIAQYGGGIHENHVIKQLNVTEIVKKECDFSQACKFIPKLLDDIKIESTDSFMDVYFNCCLNQYACRGFICPENSTCRYTGLLPPPCLCNDGFVEDDGKCIKREVIPRQIDRPPWQGWGSGIPNPLGYLGRDDGNDDDVNKGGNIIIRNIKIEHGEVKDEGNGDGNNEVKDDEEEKKDEDDDTDEVEEEVVQEEDEQKSEADLREAEGSKREEEEVNEIKIANDIMINRPLYSEASTQTDDEIKDDHIINILNDINRPLNITKPHNTLKQSYNLLKSSINKRNPLINDTKDKIISCIIPNSLQIIEIIKVIESNNIIKFKYRTCNKQSIED